MVGDDRFAYPISTLSTYDTAYALDADLVIAKTKKGMYNVSIMVTGNADKTHKRAIERVYTEVGLSGHELMLYAVRLRDNFKNVSFATQQDQNIYDQAYKETRVVT